MAQLFSMVRCSGRVLVVTLLMYAVGVGVGVSGDRVWFSSS